MKKTVFLVCFLFSLTSGFSQHWNIVSQNDENSDNFTPNNIWLSKTGNKLSLAAYNTDSFRLLSSDYPLRKKEIVAHVLLDTLLQAEKSFRLHHSFRTSPGSATRYFIKYVTDTIVFIQTILDTNDQIFDYTSNNIMVFRGLASLNSNKIIDFVSDDFSRQAFIHNNEVFTNRSFFKDTTFAGTYVQGSLISQYNYLLKHTQSFQPISATATSFFKSDSSLAGVLYGNRQTGSFILHSGVTLRNGGKVFDVKVDEASILSITDSLFNKKDVFMASKLATFPYMNYDGNNLYFRCVSTGPTFIQNTQVPPFSLGRIDSLGALEWVHAIPPNASVVQDSAFRSYVFGHLRSSGAYFGDTINALDMFMAVIDSNGAILHFETDSNWFWPNSYFYKLMYSPVTGVNLFMSHVEPVKLGDLVVPNDSGKQNMFLARFKYIEPEDTSTVAIDEKLQIFDFQLFPNPANESIHIKSSEEITRMRVLNVHGQELSRQEKLKVKEKHIDVSRLSPGVYFLQLHSKYGIRSKQFVKE